MQGPVTLGKGLELQYSGSQWSELAKEITPQFTFLKNHFHYFVKLEQEK